LGYSSKIPVLAAGASR
jgi:phage terminase Nu1 subunit (DNA packaging protein)